MIPDNPNAPHGSIKNPVLFQTIHQTAGGQWCSEIHSGWLAKIGPVQVRSRKSYHRTKELAEAYGVRYGVKPRTKPGTYLGWLTPWMRERWEPGKGWVHVAKAIEEANSHATA